MKNEQIALKPKDAVIASKILTLRNEKVILDVHLSEFYEIETRTLKQAVRRNKDRFPDDFMFELTNEEISEMVSQNVIPSKSHLGGAVPFAFTENGVAMLSSVLNSKRAIEMNIAIMRTFTLLRRVLISQKDLLTEFEKIKNKLFDHDDKILLILEYLKKMEESGQKQIDQINRNKIGFKQGGGK